MFLKKDKRPNGKTFLSIVKGYRDPVTKKSKAKSILKIGYLEDLYDEYDDPIAHFTELAKSMTEKEKLSNAPLDFSFHKNDAVFDKVNRKNIGFLVLSYFYHQLGIDDFWNNRQRTAGVEFNLNQVFQALTYLRILEPRSKKATFESLDEYLFDFDFECHDVYRALDVFNFYSDDLLLFIHESIRASLGRDVSKIFYDVTNYYFEIPYQDDFRRKGVSKEHRPKPIIQMGLLMDNDSIPISFELFKGNTNDSATLIPALCKLKKSFNLGRVIVVADKGMNSGMNMTYNILNGDGYIFSQSVRGADREVKNFVLDESDYYFLSDDFKIKSRVVPTLIWVVDSQGKRKQVRIDQKQIAFYSKKYDDKAKNDRANTIDKAQKMIAKGNSIPYSSAYKYIKNCFIDHDTGEILNDYDHLSLDTDRISEEEKYDGYYLIVSSELDMNDSDIIDAYQGLRKIEDSFKITKSTLSARPVYLSKKDHINAHFLICFVSLVILRLLEKKLKYSDVSIELAIDEMKKITATYIDENYYMLDRNNEVVRLLGDIVGIDFTKRFWSRQDIRHAKNFKKKDL